MNSFVKLNACLWRRRENQRSRLLSGRTFILFLLDQFELFGKVFLCVKFSQRKRNSNWRKEKKLSIWLVLSERKYFSYFRIINHYRMNSMDQRSWCEKLQCIWIKLRQQIKVWSNDRWHKLSLMSCTFSIQFHWIGFAKFVKRFGFFFFPRQKIISFSLVEFSIHFRAISIPCGKSFDGDRPILSANF